MEPPHIAAHRHSINNRLEVMRSALCACFDCLATFPSSTITGWTDDGDTALCPRCGNDTVIGDAAGHPLTPALLEKLHSHWCGDDDDDA